jgi:hypothetical protein
VGQHGEFRDLFTKIEVGKVKNKNQLLSSPAFFVSLPCLSRKVEGLGPLKPWQPRSAGC